MSDPVRHRHAFWPAVILTGLLFVSLPIGVASSASASATVPYSLDEFAKAFLSDAEIKALAPWGVLVADTPVGQECAVQSAGGYGCTRVYPISPYGYSKPHVLTSRTYSTPTEAQSAFSAAATSYRGKAVTVLLDAPSEFTFEWYPDPDHRVVTSGRLDRNHYVEASCAGRLTPGPPVADVNTCTQLLLNAQVPRLRPFESPRVVPPGAPTDVLASVKGSAATVTWIAPESDGGGPITAYAATSTDGALTCAGAPGAGLVQTCTATGARAGVPYTFTVTAANAKGVGPASAPSRPARFTARASAPQQPRARLSGTSVRVTWKKPASLGGLRVLRSEVTSIPGGLTCRSSSTTCSIEGLEYSTRYRFSVRAINGRGASPAALTDAVRTPAPPPPPPAPQPAPTPEPTATDKPAAGVT